MRVIAVLNPKGGSAKTTTAVNLSAALGALGRHVLLIDLDPQGSATSWLRIQGERRTIVRATRGQVNLAELAQETSATGVELVASSPMLVADSAAREADAARGLKRAMERLPSMWDFVFIDCPPTLGHLAVAPMAVSDGLLVPVPAHVLGLAGLADLMAILDRVRDGLNPELEIDGILMCRTNRSIHSRQVVERVRSAYPQYCMRTEVHESIRHAEAPGFRLPILLHAPNGRGDLDYRAAAAELLERLEGPLVTPRLAPERL